jgi:Fe-S cluster biosynthesis and repair protein YggX
MVTVRLNERRRGFKVLGPEESAMSQLTCSRCGSTADALENAPLPGEVGLSVQAQTCQACWNEWLSTQVKLINEYRISPVNPEHFEFLIKEMRTFLKLRGE